MSADRRVRYPQIWRKSLEEDGLFAGEMGRSYKGFYRLLGRAEREIGLAGNGTEAIHQSAKDRLEEYSPPYHPHQLEKYLSRPDPKIVHYP